MIDFSDINIVGLTGMSGAGKSTAARAFSEDGYRVFDCDAIYRELCRGGSRCLSEINEFFGDILTENGELDRKKLAKLVFSDEEKRQKLMKITYPYISYRVIDGIVGELKSGGSRVMIDAPTLFESGIDDICGKILSLVADREICEKRITERDKITLEAAQSRLSAQRDKAYFAAKSDFLVENNDGETELREKLDHILAELR